MTITGNFDKMGAGNEILAVASSGFRRLIILNGVMKKIWYALGLMLLGLVAYSFIGCGITWKDVRSVLRLQTVKDKDVVEVVMQAEDPARVSDKKLYYATPYYKALSERAVKDRERAEHEGDTPAILPNDRLPAQVQAAALDHQFTIWVDYSMAREDWAPSYLINKTAKAISTLAAPSPEMKLEDGHWAAAQPSIFMGVCGNSYADLPPGHYRKFMSYRPADGSPATLRFRLLVNGCFLRSNEGPGHVRPADLEAVRQLNSGGLLGHCPFSKQEDHTAPCTTTVEQSIATLELSQCFDESYRAQRSARWWLGKTTIDGGEAIDEGNDQAVAAIKRLLKMPWTHHQDYDALFKRCVAALAADPRQARYGSPEANPFAVWSILDSLAQNPPEEWMAPGRFPKKQWQEIVQRAQKVYREDGPDDIQSFVIRILSRPRICDEVPLEFLEYMFKERRSYDWRLAGIQLMKRGQRNLVARLGAQMPYEVQVSILGLELNPELAEEIGAVNLEPSELVLWNQHLTRTPGPAIELLNGALQSKAYSSTMLAHLEFRSPVIRFIEDQMKLRQAITPASFSPRAELQLHRALEALDAWHDRVDDALFESFARLEKHVVSEPAAIMLNLKSQTNENYLLEYALQVVKARSRPGHS